jgi:hypothetical protein
MSDETTDAEELPATAGSFAESQPDVWDAYSDLGQACSEAGPPGFPQAMAARRWISDLTE